MDISDPVNPVRLDHVGRQELRLLALGDVQQRRHQGRSSPTSGAAARGRAAAPPISLNWGADAIFDIVDKKLRFKGYYKMPAAQTDTENCVAHNGSIIPVPGRDIMVQGWYQGGVSVFDFTDSANPVEIAFFDRGPIDAKNLITGGYWSAYWYNGHIYGAEIARGIDVFRLTPSEYLIAERDRRGQRWCASRSSTRSSSPRSPGRRASSWPRRTWISWCAARRIDPARAKACETALDRGDTRAGRSAAQPVGPRRDLATQLETDAAAPGAKDAARMRAMAAAIKARTARLR